MLLKFSFTVLLFLSTKPCVWGVRGAPCTCFIPCFWQKYCIFLFFEFLAVVSVEGLRKAKNPEIKIPISPTLLQPFCCVKDIATSTLCGGQDPLIAFIIT